jgi:hypothetical protein
MSITRADITQTVKKFDEQLKAALNHQNPDLTPEGLAKSREKQAEAVRARFAREIQQYRATLADDARIDAFNRHRPKLDWNDPGAVAKAQSKWAAVEKKLAAGLAISEIIANADMATLAAVREFWSDHVEVQQAGNRVPGQAHQLPDTTAVSRAVDDRAAEIGGHQDALARAREAQGIHAAAEVTLTHLQEVCDGVTDQVINIETAWAANYAAQHAAAGGQALLASQQEAAA